MADRTAFIPLGKSEIAVGKITQRPIVDRHGKLLLASGRTVETPTQLSNLLGQGYIQQTQLDDVPTRPSPAPTPDQRPVQKIAQQPVPEPKGINAQMDDVRWFVGETLHMQALNELETRFVVKLIGFIKGKSVLVTAPMVDGNYVLIRDNQTFVVRAFQGRKAFAFTVIAQKSIFSPHPYLHLSYPTHVNSSVIRNDARATVNVTASVSFKNPDRTAAATLLDLSLGGGSGILKRAIAEKNESGTVSFKLSVVGTEDVLTADFIVRSVVGNEDGDGYKYGFEFQHLTPQNKLILSAFVHQAIAETL